MIDDYEMHENTRPFEPYLNPGEREELHGLLDFHGPTPPHFADNLRNLARSYIDDGDSTNLRAVCLLVADLFDQGWRVSLRKGALRCEPPSIDRHGEQTSNDVKLRIREALQSSRRRQLQQPSVASFIRRMERRTPRAQGRTSVLDIIGHYGKYSDVLHSRNAG